MQHTENLLRFVYEEFEDFFLNFEVLFPILYGVLNFCSQFLKFCFFIINVPLAKEVA